jgi:glycosyltransferase involved in cell wall biosynthesis
MINGKKVVVVMPAYNAAKTLEKTYAEVIANEVVDLVILVDDCSSDNTVLLAQRLPKLLWHAHPENRGYGGNQKTCYRIALDQGADIIVMIHPDYQYTPKLITAMVSMISSGLYEFIIGSRILGGQALRGGMPWWKYISNRMLTVVQNVLLGAKLSEYHSGYRAYSRQVIETVQFENFSDDFVFDAQMLAAIINKRIFVAEVSCPTKYFPEASSINFRRSLVYGLGCLAVAVRYSRFLPRNFRHISMERKTFEPKGFQSAR